MPTQPPIAETLDSLDQRTARLRRAYLLAAIFVVLGAVALTIDMPMARFCVAPSDGRSQLPGDVRKAVNLSEVFGHGAGVAMILVVVWVLDAGHRRLLPRLIACAFLPGLVVNLLKMMVHRVRPHALLHSEAASLSDGVFATFQGWLPWFSVGSEGQSFPSAHAATAVGLAVGLAWRYPRGRVLFAILAALAACQRVASGAHYVSDTLWGAAVGLLVASWCLYSQTAHRVFGRIERRGTPPSSKAS